VVRVIKLWSNTSLKLLETKNVWGLLFNKITYFDGDTINQLLCRAVQEYQPEKAKVDWLLT